MNENYIRLEKMSDEELTAVWDAIWELSPWDRPDEQWCEDVYTILSNRGIPAIPSQR